jgi:hypothetical protein
MACCVRSVQLAAAHVGHAPRVGEYKQASAELNAPGADIETFSPLYAFGQNWRRAREAFEVSEITNRRSEATSSHGCILLGRAVARPPLFPGSRFLDQQERN